MGDKDNENKKEKKNPAPLARSVRRKKKKGPAAAVKIPTGDIPVMFVTWSIHHSYVIHTYWTSCV